MRYIELKPGLNVKKDEIIYVEDNSDMMSCKVFTQIGAFDCIYPSWRIMMLLEQPTLEEQVALQPSTPDSTVNHFGAQHWAG